MAQKHLNAINRIVNKKCEEYRRTLNKNVHVADINFHSLRASDPDLTIEVYAELLEGLSTEFKRSYDLEDTVYFMKSGDAKAGTKYLVEDVGLGYYLVTPSYDVLQKTVSNIFKKYDQLATIFTGTDELGRTVTNIGHIASDILKNTKSPLSIKIKDALSKLPEALSEPVKIQLQNLYDIHATEVEYSFHVSDIQRGKRLQKALGNTTVLVTLHSFKKNNDLAILESRIEAEVTKYLGSIQQELLDQRASNSIKEDIAAQIAAQIAGTGDKYNSIHGRPKYSSTTKQPSSTKPKSGGQKMPPLRSKTTGRFTSIASLQSLLNQALTQQIKRNMGSGTRKDILNLRSGRFAESVKVERISQSRDGMLSAFYSYMKYPYQTFEPGYKQGRPNSRDPKLLISKSIREIAATLVNNRLRAVRL